MSDLPVCHYSQLRKIAFKIVNSTTLLGPAWKACLDELQMPFRFMPRDVATRWNSTYDMLNFALEYRKALDQVTADRGNDMRKYEMDDREWTIASQLSQVLFVSNCLTLSHKMLL